MRVLLVTMILVTALCGCSRNNGTSEPNRSGTNPTGTVPGQAARDVIDKDFVANIAATKDPYAFRIDIKRVNNKVDKVISNHEAVFADLELKDDNGKSYTGKVLEKTYAEDVNFEFDPTDATPDMPNKSGRVRLLVKKLRPGTYTVTPRVRIVEKGKDAVFGPYTDTGSVSVPADNSIKVTINK